MAQEAFKKKLTAVVIAWKDGIVSVAGKDAPNKEEAAVARAAVQAPLNEMIYSDGGLISWINEKPDQAYEWACNAAVEFDAAARLYEEERDKP